MTWATRVGRCQWLSLSRVVWRDPSRVEIKSPTWSLRQERCPCCDAEGELWFTACTSCGRLMLWCAEVGTPYSELRATRRIAYGDSRDPACKCPGCGTVSLREFRPATDSEICSAGFSPDEYV